MTAVAPARGPVAFLLRLLAWGTVGATVAFLVENYLVFWRGQPGALAFLSGDGAGWIAASLYALALALAAALAARGAGRPLMEDSQRIDALVRYFTRGCFFAVLLVGVVDVALSFLNTENLMGAIFGAEMESNLGLARWRGPYVHIPLVLVGFAIALFTRGVPMIWLALMLVATQLLLVIGRFIFSYEQPFMADLVRMWYAALFLFASAYTLVEDGHVRVDVFYTTMSRRGKALVNGLGSVFLGMSLCWVILILGTATRASPINGPIIGFEMSQQAGGMFTKYFFAGFLAVFAISMMLQFTAYMLRAAAQYRGEPDPDPDPGPDTGPDASDGRTSGSHAATGH